MAKVRVLSSREFRADQGKRPDQEVAVGYKEFYLGVLCQDACERFQREQRDHYLEGEEVTRIARGQQMLLSHRVWRAAVAWSLYRPQLGLTNG